MRPWIVHTTLVAALALAGATAATAQTTGSVTGTVVDLNSRQPLDGAQVTIVGTQLGGLANAEGRFLILNVPVGPRAVRVERIGYATSEQRVTVVAGQAARVDFQLATQAVQLQGLVAIGYGTQKKETITSSIASVTAEQFVKGPANSAANLIAGKMPGLAVTQSSGNPGSNPDIQLRGISSISASRSPLVLVDGVPGGMSTVAPEDIESISVLKDGSAAAIYGSRASNGVILITTKKHSGGNATLRYDGFISASTIYRRPDFLTAEDYVRLKGEGWAFDNFGTTTNWQDLLLRTPVSYRHNLTISGGAQNTNYTASINLENRQGIFELSENHDFTTRANIRHQMFNGKLEAEGNFVHSASTNPNSGPDYNYIWRQVLIRNPTDSVYHADGTYNVRSTYFYENPIQLLNETTGQSQDRSTRLHGTVTFRPLQQLRFTAMGGTTESNSLTGWTRTLNHPSSAGGLNSANRGTSSSYDRIAELTGTFQQNFGDHAVTALGGYSYSDRVSEDFSASNTMFPTDLFDWNNLGRGDYLGQGKASMSSGKSDRKLIGFFGRVNYDYKNRYMLMASLRHEGDSRFGSGHKWGDFPAISLGWRISAEPFMEAVPVKFDDLRLRFGYGVTGMAPGSSYQSLTRYSYSSSRFFYNGNWVQTLGPAANPNPDLKWEEKRETNFGLNFAVLDSRLNGTVDVYRRETVDMLYSYSVPVPPNIFGSLLANVGTMQNNGIEAELSYDVVRKPGFNWTTSVNWSKNSNKLVALSDSVAGLVTNPCFWDGHTGEPIQRSITKNCVGDQIGNFYGLESVDIDSLGVFLVRDSLGTSIIRAPDAKDKDYRNVGNGYPKMNFAWNNTARIGKFDLSVNMRGAADFQIVNLMNMYYTNPRNTQYNMLKGAFDKVYGKRVVNGDLAYVSYYIEQGDYLKVDNATIGYTLNSAALGRLGSSVKNVRLYVSGRNLLTITGYKGLDPEVPAGGMSPGIDQRDKYPTIRTFTAGVTMNF